MEIEDREKSVIDAWKELLATVQKRAALLTDALDKFRFINTGNDLIGWMEGTMTQMESQEKPRSVRIFNSCGGDG